MCAELCRSDKDCQCGEKCCFNGCGRECISTGEILGREKNNPSYTCVGTKPTNICVSVKPGSCGSPWVFFWCGDYCHNDSDCPGHMKCCPSIWGHVCKEPHLPH